MSKYEKLWEYISKTNDKMLVLSFDEIKEIIGCDIDHSFLNYKKDLFLYGFRVEKIFLKEQKIAFVKLES